MSKLLLVGCGHMGRAHAKAYQNLAGCQIVGVVNRGAQARERLAQQLGGLPAYANYYEAVDALQPDAVSINSYTETHAPYAIEALQRGLHVFVEKPLASSPEEAQKVVHAAQQYGGKLVIGYILRHHPSWIRFIEEARQLGAPLVMRMNLNQQSEGHKWHVHKKLLELQSPIVDCGVHYIDAMCQMARAEPIWVSAIGARLTEEIAPTMVNYGQIQIRFSNGTIGWFECGWGPMMSNSAAFVKDVIGPNGSVSFESQFVKHMPLNAVDILRVHHSTLNAANEFTQKDTIIELADAPDLDGLCLREQRYFLKAIEEDVDLSEHHQAALNSLRVVCAADFSLRSGQPVNLIACPPV